MEEWLTGLIEKFDNEEIEEKPQHEDAMPEDESEIPHQEYSGESSAGFEKSMRDVSTSYRALSSKLEKLSKHKSEETDSIQFHISSA